MIIALLRPRMASDLGAGAATGIGLAGEVGASLMAAVVLTGPVEVAAGVARRLLLLAAGFFRGGGGAGGTARVAATEVMSSSPAGGVSNFPVGSYSTPRSCQRIWEGVWAGRWLNRAGISASP